MGDEYDALLDAIEASVFKVRGNRLVRDKVKGLDGASHRDVADHCVFEVRREDQDFHVGISRDAQEISVQEVRADPYMPIE